ncbi:cdk-12, partial [Symbiodinium sp. KB8]
MADVLARQGEGSTLPDHSQEAEASTSMSLVAPALTAAAASTASQPAGPTFVGRAEPAASPSTAAGTPSPTAQQDTGGPSVPSDVPGCTTEPAAATSPPAAIRRRREGCRDISSYRTEGKVGEGTFGVVTVAFDRVTGRKVACKRIKPDGEGLHQQVYVGELSPVTLRKHMGAPLLTNTFTASDANEHLGSVFMVFDFFDFDLYKLIRDKKLTLDRIKSYTLQLVSGLCVMANRGYLHRDLKPANLLVNKQNELVIADFGLARPMPDVVGEGRPMTTKVCTLYYRAPELLLGCTAYDSRSDMWAVGLMVLEMFTRRVALPGATEGEQLGLIVKLVGSPNIETTQVLEDYPHYNTFKNHLKGSQNNLRRRYESILPPDALDLVEQLLVLNPKKRLTAQQVLGHPFFMTSGKYIEASELPSLEEHPPQVGEQPSTAAARPGTGAALRPEAPTLVPADPDPVAFEPAQPQGRALKRTRD